MTTTAEVMISAEEWEAVAEVLEECFPGEWTDRKSRAWRLALGDRFAATAILAAIRRVSAGGARFRPSLGEILDALTSSPSVPTFPEAFGMLFEIPDRVFRGDLSQVADETLVERAADFHPWLAAFGSCAGWQRLRSLPLNDPDWGEKRRDDLRREYEDFIVRCEEREAHGVAIELSARRASIGRFDPLAALGLGGRPALAAGKTP